MEDDAVSGHTLDDLVNVLGIPGPNRRRAKLRLREMIGAVCNAHERDVLNKQIINRKADKEALKQVAKAARKLRTALDACTDGATHHLDVAWPKDASTPEQLYAALDAFQRIGEQPGKKRASSPTAIVSLVGWLAGIAAEFDGRADIQPEAGKGRLVDALEILRKILPAGIIPDPLPYATIERWTTAHSKLRTRLTI